MREHELTALRKGDRVKLNDHGIAEGIWKGMGRAPRDRPTTAVVLGRSRRLDDCVILRRDGTRWPQTIHHKFLDLVPDDSPVCDPAARMQEEEDKT